VVRSKTQRPSLERVRKKNREVEVNIQVFQSMSDLQARRQSLTSLPTRVKFESWSDGNYYWSLESVNRLGILNLRDAD